MNATLILAWVLLAAWIALQVYIKLQPKTHIVTDFSKLLCCNQYEQAVYLLKNSNKKHLARELKGIMKDAKKKDLKGYCNPACSQKCRYRFAYELYIMFVGELKVKTDYLDQCELDEGRRDYIERLKAIVG